MNDLELTQFALEGKRGEDQQDIAVVGLDIVSTLLKKNMDYGSSVFKEPLLCPGLTPRQGIQVRMSDKLCRLQRLLAGNPAEVAESLEDTMRDLAGYAILWLSAEE